MSDSDDSEWGSSDDDDNAPPSMMFCDEENNYMSVHDVEMGGVLELKLQLDPGLGLKLQLRLSLSPLALKPLATRPHAAHRPPVRVGPRVQPRLAAWLHCQAHPVWLEPVPSMSVARET